MHIGCCENCRYIDLVENLVSGCQRCGGRMISLGVDSVQWNRMNAEARKSLIIRVLTEPDLRPARTPEAEKEREIQEKTREKMIKQAEARGEQVRRAEAILEQARQTETSVEAARRAEYEAAVAQLQSQKQAKEQQEEYVFVCCKCRTLAGHNRSRSGYFCPECGAEMIDVDCKVSHWSEMSKEEKRRIMEDAQIRQMVSALEMASDEYGDESMPNIVNVVGTK